MDNETAPVTVIGLGLMGRALAGAFLRAGHPTTMWNRTASKAEQLVAEGARLAPTVGDALETSSVAIVCLTDYEVVRELFGADEIKLDGTLLINLTSGDSAQAGRPPGGPDGAAPVTWTAPSWPSHRRSEPPRR
ncbi:NAD(P)-binding domain-containing protein [Actinomadura madurae]|uniref:NAD(P)-binding domain-containing protein n=1 Tax=Actinomadura madurae TaxID=1993 RepID=UPI0020261209|nr:NAD(P)-binding domain-containing protein [Actinomadura madurae]URN09354.1 NAD(P)-binding domain-containing protein [Actinomadura madurae]